MTTDASLLAASMVSILKENANGGTVALTSTSGATVVKTEGFKYLAQGIINAVTPSTGQHGTRVVLTGTSLLGGGTKPFKVTLNGVVAVVTKFSAEEIVLTAGASDCDGISAKCAGGVMIIADTGATVHRHDGWRYLKRGIVNDIRPNSGVVGTRVALFGERLRGGGTKVIDVTVGGVSTKIVDESDKQLNVVVTKRTHGTFDVQITSESGAVITKPQSFKYIEVIVNSLEPATGQEGTNVRLHGENMFGGGAKIVNADYCWAAGHRHSAVVCGVREPGSDVRPAHVPTGIWPCGDGDGHRRRHHNTAIILVQNWRCRYESLT